MPKCEKGHQTKMTMLCEVCGAPVLYSEELDSLVSLPNPEIKYEDVSVLFSGIAPFQTKGIHTCVVGLGEKDERLADRYAVRMVGGGTWLDYFRNHRQRIRSWMELTGFSQSKSKVVVLDTSSPLSVLLLDSLKPSDGFVVLAVVADRNSNPLDQNASYVACELISRKGLPTIFASASYVGSMSIFSEEEGLITGEAAFQRFSCRLVESLGALQEFVRKDLRLGIRSHYFSCIMGASDFVFKSPSGAFQVLGTQPSLVKEQEDVLSAYLISRAGPDQNEELASSFSKYSKGIGNLLATGSALGRKESPTGLYDIILIYGVKDAHVKESIEKGYETVKKNAQDLGVEELEKFV